MSIKEALDTDSIVAETDINIADSIHAKARLDRNRLRSSITGEPEDEVKKIDNLMGALSSSDGNLQVVEDDTGDNRKTDVIFRQRKGRSLSGSEGIRLKGGTNVRFDKETEYEFGKDKNGNLQIYIPIIIRKWGEDIKGYVSSQHLKLTNDGRVRWDTITPAHGGEPLPTPGGEPLPTPGGEPLPTPGGEPLPTPGGEPLPTPGGEAETAEAKALRLKEIQNSFDFINTHQEFSASGPITIHEATGAPGYYATNEFEVGSFKNQFLIDSTGKIKWLEVNIGTGGNTSYRYFDVTADEWKDTLEPFSPEGFTKGTQIQPIIIRDLTPAPATPTASPEWATKTGELLRLIGLIDPTATRVPPDATDNYSIEFHHGTDKLKIEVNQTGGGVRLLNINDPSKIKYLNFTGGRIEMKDISATEQGWSQIDAINGYLQTLATAPAETPETPAALSAKITEVLRLCAILRVKLGPTVSLNFTPNGFKPEYQESNIFQLGSTTKQNFQLIVGPDWKVKLLYYGPDALAPDAKPTTHLISVGSGDVSTDRWENCKNDGDTTKNSSDYIVGFTDLSIVSQWLEKRNYTAGVTLAPEQTTILGSSPIPGNYERSVNVGDSADVRRISALLSSEFGVTDFGFHEVPKKIDGVDATVLESSDITIGGRTYKIVVDGRGSAVLLRYQLDPSTNATNVSLAPEIYRGDDPSRPFQLTLSGNGDNLARAEFKNIAKVFNQLRRYAILDKYTTQLRTVGTDINSFEFIDDTHIISNDIVRDVGNGEKKHYRITIDTESGKALLQEFTTIDRGSPVLRTFKDVDATSGVINSTDTVPAASDLPGHYQDIATVKGVLGRIDVLRLREKVLSLPAVGTLGALNLSFPNYETNDLMISEEFTIDGTPYKLRYNKTNFQAQLIRNGSEYFTGVDGSTDNEGRLNFVTNTDANANATNYILESDMKKILEKLRRMEYCKSLFTKVDVQFDRVTDTHTFSEVIKVGGFDWTIRVDNTTNKVSMSRGSGTDTRYLKPDGANFDRNAEGLFEFDSIDGLQDAIIQYNQQELRADLVRLGVMMDPGANFTPVAGSPELVEIGFKSGFDTPITYNLQLNTRTNRLVLLKKGTGSGGSDQQYARIGTNGIPEFTDISTSVGRNKEYLTIISAIMRSRFYDYIAKLEHNDLDIQYKKFNYFSTNYSALSENFDIAQQPAYSFNIDINALDPTKPTARLERISKADPNKKEYCTVADTAATPLVLEWKDSLEDPAIPAQNFEYDNMKKILGQIKAP